MADSDVCRFQRMGKEVADALRARKTVDEQGGNSEEEVRSIRLQVTTTAHALLVAFNGLYGKFFPDMANMIAIMALRELVRDKIHTLSVDRPVCPRHLGNLLTALESLSILNPAALSSPLLGPEFDKKKELN
ncbi:MAG: hypothetical protein ABIG34_03630 [Candidatus Peregrinibacteria bacterium]